MQTTHELKMQYLHSSLKRVEKRIRELEFLKSTNTFAYAMLKDERERLTELIDAGGE